MFIKIESKISMLKDFFAFIQMKNVQNKYLDKKITLIFYNEKREQLYKKFFFFLNLGLY